MNKKEALESITTILGELDKMDDFILYEGNFLLTDAKILIEKHVFEMKHILKNTK